MSTGKAMAALSAYLRATDQKLARGWQQRVAGLAGVSAETITRWKKGRGNPKLSEVEALADALETSVAALFSGAPAAPPPSLAHDERADAALDALERDARALVAGLERERAARRSGRR